MKDYKIFGIAGANASGKDTLAEILVRNHNMMYVSVSDLLRAEATRRGLDHSRKSTRDISAEWRREHGMDVLVQKSIEHFEKKREHEVGVAIGSLRHPGETEAIHKVGGIQIWTDADPKIRYERIIKANRGRLDVDDKSFEEFTVDEAKEMAPEGDSATLNGGAVKELADVFIYNEGSDLREFELNTEIALRDYL